MFYVDLPIDTQVTSELIAYFIGNTYAKYYENPTMLSRVTAKNVGDFFETHCIILTACFGGKFSCRRC